MKIALTGGIACGKSTLAKFLRELGIRLLDADDVVHELEGPSGEAVPRLVERFGPSILDARQGIDRRRLAEQVFTSSDAQAARRDLEKILFPLVRTRLRAFIEKGTDLSGAEKGTDPVGTPKGTDPVGAPKGTGPSEIRIAIVPLLFESHFDSDYDTILSISSPWEVQLDRMIRTRGYSREEAEARLAAQMPVAEKVARSHFSVVNDSTPEHLQSEAVRLVAWLKERAKNEY